jgi:VCBS repeat-containing protein
VADTPTLTAPQLVSGNEGQPIALNVSSALPEVDKDAVLTLTIGGIPDGVKLDDANHDRIVITNGTATLTPGELAGLTLTGDAVTQHFDLTLTASAVDGSSVGTPVTTTLHVDVAPAAVTEDVNVVAGNLTTAGSVSFADVGLSNTHSLVSVVPQGNNYLGTFTPTLGADGTVAWTFTVADDATDFLAQGQTLTQTYALTVDDGHGVAVTQKVVVDIIGTNEAPVIVAAATTATGTVTEDTNADANNNLSAAGTVSFTDVDLTDTHSVSVSVPAGSNYLGTFTPTFTAATDATGGKTGTVGWNFTVADDATDFLAQGQTLTQTYTVTVADNHGGTTKQDVVVTINGSNEAPVVTADESTGSLTEPTDTPTQDNSVPGALLTTNGSFTFTDVDIADKHTIIDFSPAGRGASPFGELKDVSISTDTVNGIGGVVSCTYTIPVAAVESLSAGETLDESFNVTIADNHGGTATKTVTVTTVGTNDFPVAHDDVLTSINGSPLTKNSAPISLNSTLATVLKANDILDPDHGSPNSVTFGSSVTVAPNDFGITASDVTFTASGFGKSGGGTSLTLGSKFQTLTDGEFIDIVLPYTLKGDQPTDVSTANVTFHVAGVNTPPITNDVTVDAANIAAGIKLTGSDVDGTIVSFTINDLPAGGTLFTDAAETQVVHAGDVIAASGNAATLFFKAANAGGSSTSFHFTATDSEGLPSVTEGTATINVNHPPVAVDQTFTVTEDGSLNITAALGVLKGDSDPDVGDTFKITAINGNDGSGIGVPFDLHLGNIVLQSDGSFTYQPQTAAGSPAQSLHAGQTGVDSFTYTITDSHGATSTANVNINVTGDSDPPIAVTSGIVIASGVSTAVDWHLTVAGNPPLPLTFAVTQSFGHTDQWGPFLSFDTTTGQFRVQTLPANGATPAVSGAGSHDVIDYSVTDSVPGDSVGHGQLTFDRIDGSIPFNIDQTNTNGDDFHFLGGAGGMDRLGSGNNQVETSGVTGTITEVFGGSGNNTFIGGPGGGQNKFHGGSGNDIFHAGFHSDILDGGGGNNQFFVGTTSLVSGQVNHATITGGSGNNLFALSNSDAASSTFINDYHFTPGGAQDTIDLTSLSVLNLGAGAAAFNNTLFGTPGSPQPLFDPIANGLNFNDFIKLVDDGTDVHLQVDPDGTGTGFQFHDVALLRNHHAADFTDIIIAGQDHIQFHGNNVEITDSGGAGNTTLYSGYSFLAGQTVHETLTGGGGNTGHTIFSFNSTDPGTTATINNFATGGRQDVLDFSNLNLINHGAAFNQALFGTSGFDPTINGKNVSDFVQLLNDPNGHDVHVKVDADGTAATGFHDIAVLHNYQTSGNPVDILFANAHQAILHVA